MGSPGRDPGESRTRPTRTVTARMMAVEVLALICCTVFAVWIYRSFRFYASAPRSRMCGYEQVYVAAAEAIPGASFVAFIGSVSLSRANLIDQRHTQLEESVTYSLNHVVGVAVDRHAALRLRLDSSHSIHLRSAREAIANVETRVESCLAENHDLVAEEAASVMVNESASLHAANSQQRTMRIVAITSPHPTDDALVWVTLVLGLHHAVCDGLSGITLLGALLHDMCAVESETTSTTRCPVMALPVPLPSRILHYCGVLGSVGAYIFGLVALVYELSLPLYAVVSLARAPIIDHAIRSTALEQRCVTYPLVVTLDSHLMRQLRSQCRIQGVSFNACLHGALVVALRQAALDGHSVLGDSNDILVRASVDFRSRLAPTVPRTELSYCVGSASTWHKSQELGSAVNTDESTAAMVWNAAAADHVQMRQNTTGYRLWMLFGWSLVREWLTDALIKRQTRSNLDTVRPAATVITSNVGDCSSSFNVVGMPFESGAASCMRRVAFFSSVNSWKTLEVTACTVGGVMTLVFACPVLLAGDAGTNTSTADRTKVEQLISEAKDRAVRRYSPIVDAAMRALRCAAGQGASQ